MTFSLGRGNFILTATIGIILSSARFSGSATYSCKYDPLWSKTYPCIYAVKNNSHSFYCTCCLKKISCKHMGISDVKRHIQMACHQKASKGMEMQMKLAFNSPNVSCLRKVEHAEVKMNILSSTTQCPFISSTSFKSDD